MPGPSDAVGARLARTVNSPMASSAGWRAACAAAARSARDAGSPPQAASSPAVAAAARMRMRRARSVIGRGEFAPAAGRRADRARDQAAQVAGLEGLDRGLGGAAGRGDAAPELGGRLAGFD